MIYALVVFVLVLAHVSFLQLRKNMRNDLKNEILDFTDDEWLFIVRHPEISETDREKISFLASMNYSTDNLSYSFIRSCKPLLQKITDLLIKYPSESAHLSTSSQMQERDELITCPSENLCLSPSSQMQERDDWLDIKDFLGIKKSKNALAI